MKSHVKHTGESVEKTQAAHNKYGNKEGYAHGGRVDSYPDMKSGSASGEGRLEKIKEYGKNAKD